MCVKLKESRWAQKDEVADRVCEAGALGRLEQQERLQRSSRCMESRCGILVFSNGQWSLGGRGGENWEAERQRGCPD